jgi:hypothetical protein
MHASDVTPGSGTRARRELGRAVLVVAVLNVGLGLLVLALISDVSAVGRLAGAIVAIAATAVLAVLVASRHVVRRGLAALVAGVVGVSLGGAIGPVWLATTGPGAVAFVALACLTAGLLLAGAGTWLLGRALPGWWRLAALPVAFLLLQFVVPPLAGAIYGTHPPRTPVSGPMPSGARLVALETPDGVTLEA